MNKRFQDLDIGKLTIKNYREILSDSLADQVSIFIPPQDRDWETLIHFLYC